MKRTSLALVIAALAAVTITPASAQRFFGRGGENAEAKTVREAARQAIIDDYDANGDGVLDTTEREAASAARKALRVERSASRRGGDRSARTQAIIERMKAAIESGVLPEGVTPEQAAEGLAKLENALATGQRPDGERPANVVRPEGIGLPENAGFPGGAARVQAIIDRINAAIEGGSLPDNVTAEQAAERVAMLEQALATGERPANVDGRPEGMGRPSGFRGRRPR